MSKKKKQYRKLPYNSKQEIGERLRVVRRNEGHSIQHTADQLGIKRTTYNAYELGVSSMPDDLKNLFVKLYDISHNYLNTGSDSVHLEEPVGVYQNLELPDLLTRLGDSSVHDEVRRKVFSMMSELVNTQQALKESQDKVISLLEKQTSILEVLKKQYNINL